MITALHIRQFALIDALDLHCEAGMTAFTGETGAGKSIVVDALGALFGARARADWVRHGAEKAEISAVVELPRANRAWAWLRDAELDGEDDALLLRRVINADGRSRAWINGTPVALKQLQALGNMLFDLHGQHEHQTLLQPDFQRQLVDCGVDAALLAAGEEAWQRLQQARDALAELEGRQQQVEMQAGWMREQLQRLEQLDPEPDGVERLSQQVAALRNASAIRQRAASAIALLDGEEDHHARGTIAAALHQLAGGAALHPALGEAEEILTQIEPLLDEAVRLLRPALEVQADEAELDRLEGRIAQLQEAMRRHHCDEAGLCRLMEQWRNDLAAQETAEWDRRKLTQELEEAEQAWRAQAKALHDARCRQAKALVAALRPLLDRLGLATMQVTIDVAYQPEAANRFGCDRVRFLAASNPGEPSRPLADIASGGELSRMVLALKGCGALRGAPAIAVFDEVDVGIGGETAWCVGELLAAMGRERQLFVISHLPQVAASADHQVAITKQQQGGRTVTRVAALDRAGREREIARMLGDSRDTVTLNQAKQMLDRVR